MKNNLFGITNIMAITIPMDDENSSLNDFLSDHDGDIIDIQPVMENGKVEFIVIYQNNKSKNDMNYVGCEGCKHYSNCTICSYCEDGSEYENFSEEEENHV